MKKNLSLGLLIFSIIYCFIILTLFGCVKKNCIAKENANCICTKNYWPVCGCDGITYDNACIAKCASVDIMYEGKCK